MLIAEDLPYESNPAMSYFVQNPQLSQYSSDEIYYTMQKVIEAKYIEFQSTKTLSNSFDGFFVCITWNGHQFLDTIRDPKVWSMAKTIASHLESVSISMLSNIGTGVINHMIDKLFLGQ